MLNELGIKYGTDKAGHGYLDVYELYLGPDRLDERIKNVLEIGVHLGASVKMWKEYFPYAEIHGIDNVPQKKEYEEDRIHIHIGSQEDSAFLTEIGKKISPLNIVIDDGGHMMSQQIKSFFELFPFVESGGLYIIEDLHTSYHSEFKGSSVITTVEYLKQMIDDVNMHGYNYGNLKRAILPSYYEQSISSIHFHKSLCIIEKK
jgi:hypothetical protein